jgi:hypothetical protein
MDMFPESLEEDATNARMKKSQDPFEIDINNSEYNKDSIINGKVGLYLYSLHACIGLVKYGDDTEKFLERHSLRNCIYRSFITIVFSSPYTTKGRRGQITFGVPRM